MSDIELNDKLVSELREIAKSLGIADADELRKAQLIASIVEQQNLIEAARAQRETMNNNYAPLAGKEETPAAETGERTRKRIRVIKGKPAEKLENKPPRPRVALDDTTLFDEPDDEVTAPEEA